MASVHSEAPVPLPAPVLSEEEARPLLKVTWPLVPLIETGVRPAPATLIEKSPAVLARRSKERVLLVTHSLEAGGREKPPAVGGCGGFT